jgi:hypothetical protein
MPCTPHCGQLEPPPDDQPRSAPPPAGGAPDPETADHPTTAPEATELFAYELQALAARQALITDHLRDIDAALVGILARQHIIARHCLAIRDHLERGRTP